MPEVSVLIPTYNRSAYLMQAVQSVEAQTFKDWEIIVVDDGSTDETTAMASRFARAIRYEYQRNQGVSSARNRAFALAGGEYVVFLDSDDLLLPNSLAILSQALHENPDIGVVHSNGYVIDQTGRRVGELSAHRRLPVEDTLEYFVLGSPVIGLHSAMIRRTALEAVDGPFDETMAGYEDWDLFLRLKVSGTRFLFLPEPTCCYRFHGGNKSAPQSTLSEKRRQALERNRMKVLAAPWFDSLSLPARQQFFLHCLTGPLQGRWADQERILQHPSFQALPAPVRSHVLFYLAVDNLLGEASWRQEARRLVNAIRLRPQDPRPYALLLGSLPGPAARRWLIQSWRRWRSQPQEIDPVTQILRAKNVA